MTTRKDRAGGSKKAVALECLLLRPFVKLGVPAILALIMSLFVALPGGFAQTNDECSTAKTIAVAAGAPYTDMMSTTTATASATDPLQCSGSEKNTVWYTFQSTAAAPLYINTVGSDYDTVLSVYTGTCGSLTEVDCNDDDVGTQSSVLITTAADTTYYVMVASYSSGGGQLKLNASRDTPGSISGTVTGTGGVAVPSINVSVYALAGDYYDWVRSVSTDASGTYSVDGLTAGTYKVQFSDGSGE